MYGIKTTEEFTYKSRDPEGTRGQKLRNLTGGGSQEHFDLQGDEDQELDAGIVELSPDRRPGEESNEQHLIPPESDIDQQQEVMMKRPSDITSGKRPVEDMQPSPPTKKRATKSTSPSEDDRQLVRSEILKRLQPLSSPVPRLLERTAERLEQAVFVKSSKDPSVNALGRSSTLVTSTRTLNHSQKYTREKEKLFQKVSLYVETATKEDATLEQIQQGEIWEIIREILDENV
jgi:hypothetical protein